MGFLKKLASLFSGPAGPRGENIQYVYVQCQACGEPLALRVNLGNDLSPEWSNTSASGSDQPDFYACHKTVIGRERCYRPIEVYLTFNRQKRLESQQATGGTILIEEEYRQAVAQWEAKRDVEQ